MLYIYIYICIPKRHQVAVTFFTWTLGAYLTLSQVPRINKLLMENVPRAIGWLDREFNWTKTWRRCKFFFSSKVVDCKTDMWCVANVFDIVGVCTVYKIVFKTCFWNHGCVTPKDSSFWHFGQAFSCLCLCSMGAFGSKHNAATTCKNIFISAFALKGQTFPPTTLRTNRRRLWRLGGSTTKRQGPDRCI